MKKIKVDKKYSLVSDIDFEYLNQFYWRLHTRGYAYRLGKIDNKWKIILMHNDINIYKKQGQFLDHINSNKLDNRHENLRPCSDSQNKMNCGKYKNNRCGYKGVYKMNNKRIGTKVWRAEIRANRIRYPLGVFYTKEEAAKAYNEAAKIHHGQFAVLNQL